jgi:chloramphenicol O-acetyltransferase type A
MTHRKIDLAHWNRRRHFEFFRSYDEPYFGVCVEVDCTTAYRQAKEMNTSFFLYYLHKSITAANSVENFRYRIAADGGVNVFDRVDASSTIDRPDGTFGFSYIPFHPDYPAFERIAKEEIARVRQSEELLAAGQSDCVIHYSSLPWMRFTSFSHARHFSERDSSPKIAFGKLTSEGDRRLMPASLHVHHALVDGRHVGAYYDAFQELLNSRHSAS